MGEPPSVGTEYPPTTTPPSPVITGDGEGEPPSVGIVFPPPTKQEPEPTPPPFEICPPPPTPALSPDDSNSIVPPPVPAPIVGEDGGVLEPCPAPTAGGYPSAETMIPPVRSYYGY
jgi:type VI secretion system secreted protein VgrG